MVMTVTVVVVVVVGLDGFVYATLEAVEAEVWAVPSSVPRAPEEPPPTRQPQRPSTTTTTTQRPSTMLQTL